MTGKRLNRATLLLFAALLAACAMGPRPLAGIVPGRTVETLQSTVEVSLTSAGRTNSGRGYLIYQQPDLFRLAILSPFGQSLLEVFGEGERFTCLLPGKGLAYQGRVSDLPDRQGLRLWGVMRWVVAERGNGPPNGVSEGALADGRRERIFFNEDGLVAKKETDDGDRVTYRDYLVANGVPLPAVIEIANWRGDTVRLAFEEPEVNAPLVEGALQPVLTGLTVLPLTEFKGL